MKKGKISTAGIIVIVFLILILVAIFIGSNLQKKPAATQEKGEEQPAEEKATTPAEGSSTPATQLSQAEVEQIKMDIITGKRVDVPLGSNLIKRTIIRDYLSNCHMIIDLNKGIECFELYYLNNNASLMRRKNECLDLSNDEKTNCLDQYYFYMGTWEQAIFCDAIINEELRKECEQTAI